MTIMFEYEDGPVMRSMCVHGIEFTPAGYSTCQACLSASLRVSHPGATPCEHGGMPGDTCTKCTAWPAQAAALERVERPDTPAWEFR